MKSSLALALLLSIPADAKELPPEVAAKLAKDGVVVVDKPKRQCFSVYLDSPYPAFVTSDSLLMACSRLFEETVARGEIENLAGHLRFWPTYWPEVAKAALTQDPVDLEGHRRSRLAWATALHLLTGKLPEGLDGKEAEAVELEAKRVESGTGQAPPPWLRPAGEKNPPYVNYPAFAPRSFHEDIAALARYHRFRKWLQEMPLDFSDEATISMAEHLGLALSGTTTDEGYSSAMALFRGDSCLFVPLLLDAWRTVSPEELGEWRKELRQKFSERSDWRFIPSLVHAGSEIARELLPVGKAARTPEVLGAALRNPVASALLGPEFQKARELEAEQLQRELEFLHVLNKAPDSRAPGLFRSEAWQRKQLNTTLGYWAEYRFALQLASREDAHWMGVTDNDAGFVEPYPEFYHKLGLYAQAQATGNGWEQGSPEAAQLRLALELEKVAGLLREATAERNADHPETIGVNDAYQSVVAREELLIRLFPAPSTELDSDPEWDWTSRKDRLAVATLAEELLAAYWRGDPAATTLLTPPADTKDELTPRWWQLAATCFRLEAMAERQLAGLPWRPDDSGFLENFGPHLGWLMFYEGNSYLSPLDDAPRIARYATLDGPTGATIYHAAVARPRSLLIQYHDHEGKPILCEGAVYAFRNIEAKETPGRATWIKDAERTAWPAWMSGMIVPPEPAK